MSLHDASNDLRYLLNHGYNKTSAVTFVCNHYQLDKEYRHFLARSIFSDDAVKTTIKKKLPIQEIEGKDLVIDGFNVLITTEAVLKNAAFLCDDAVVRDAQGIFGKYTITDDTWAALNTICDILIVHPPAVTTFYFDQQVSHSGDICSYIKNHFPCETTKHVDLLLSSLNKITATSDSVLIEKLDHFVDIPLEILLSKNL
jgi:hypothetical protein